MTVLAVALAGALGALCRYAIALMVGPLAFPWATLGINVAGSFLLGLLYAVAPIPDGMLKVAVGTGFLGAFTTFSTFSVETVALVRDGRPVLAAAYVLLSVVMGVVAAYVGLLLGQRVT